MIPYRSVHFVGVLTPDMASLAYFTAQSGSKISGSDESEQSIYLPPLLAAGLTFFSPFAQLNLPRTTDLVVVSSYYDLRHVEAVAAQSQKIPVMTATAYAKEISELYRRFGILDSYDGPLIASSLDHTLAQGHMPTNSLIESVPIDQTAAMLARATQSDWFVMPLSGFKRDAGTYEAAFLSFSAEIVILPAIRYDFPELNTTLDDVYQSQYRFVKTIPRKGLIIGNSDWSRMKRLCSHLADRHIETYGFDTDAAWRIRDVEVEDNSTTFYLFHQKHNYGPFTIPFVGEARIYSAAAVAVASLLLEMKPETVGRGLASLPALKRYFEVQLDKNGRLIIDDQADHPDTIAALLKTVRETYPDKKIWCLYQPASYLRTKAMLNEFVEALSLADVVYLADIKGYPKEKSEGLNVRHLVAAAKQHHSQTFYLDPSMSMTELLQERVALNDCIVVLGVEGVCQSIVQPLLPSSEQASSDAP